MPTYTVTAHHVCMRCGATATDAQPVVRQVDSRFDGPKEAWAPGWREVAIPTPAGQRTIKGELCPACVAAVAAFILPSKES